MLTLNLPSELEQRLSEWATNTHHSKDYCVQLALEEFLDDYEVHSRALDRWQKVERGESQLISLEDVEAQFDLKHGH